MAKTSRLPLWDIHQVSWLDYNHTEVTETERDGRVVFEVPATEKTYQLLQQYQTNPMVPLLDFVRSLRRVRARMLSLRDGKRERNHGRSA